MEAPLYPYIKVSDVYELSKNKPTICTKNDTGLFLVEWSLIATMLQNSISVTTHMSKTVSSMFSEVVLPPYDHKFIILFLYMILKVLFVYKNNQNILFHISPSRDLTSISFYSF